MKIGNSVIVSVLMLGFIVFGATLHGQKLTEELTRDNASKPIIFLYGPVPDKLKYQGKEYEIWLRDPNNTSNLIQKTNIATGTGFIVGYKGNTYLVTAKHIAQETSINWMAVTNGPNDTSVRFTFADFSGYTSELPWVSHPLADVAVLHLQNESQYCSSGIVKRFDMTVFIRKEAAPSREKVLTILGFPLALGVGQKISPLTKESKAASGLYDIRKDIGTITVFFLSDPSIDGYSGSPVFAFPTKISDGGSTIRVGSQRTQCYGLVSATLPDRTGGKLAQIVPSSQICETIIRATLQKKDSAKLSYP